MGGRNLDAGWLVGVAGLAALACSGRSIDHERNSGGNAARAGDSGAQGGAAGLGGSGGATSTGGSKACEAGTARCNSDGIRETCTRQATWSVTDFVCARNVAVDDQLGTYCVTKSDGTYRCWGGEALGELPPERYVRVQLVGYGDSNTDAVSLPVVGLTDDGRLLAVGLDLTSDTSPVVAFRATNMGGYQAVCPLLADGTLVALYQPRVDIRDFERVHPFDARLSRGFCVWEGLLIGIRTDGTLWSNDFLDVMPGNDWVEVAHSVGILCGIKATGEVACGPSLVCGDNFGVDCLNYAPPVFPPGRYRALAATSSSVCALDDQGALLCKRFDGADMPIDPGPYTFVEGGRDVVCALRVDGSTACFSHGGETFPTAVGPFVPIEPAIDQGW